jgi:hypothetical protein
VGSAYKWDVGVSFVEKLTALRNEYGRQNEPFEIMFALLEQPTPDLYKRAEDIGITALMWNPWAGLADVPDGDRDAGKQNTDRYRAAIERFAEDIIAKWR